MNGFSAVRRAAGVAAALCAVALGSAPPAGAAPDEAPVAIRGRVVDETGKGIPGQTVRLLRSRTYLRLGGMRSLDQSVEDRRATTDALGFFEMSAPYDPSFPYAYLRYYDPNTFDAIQYRLPEDRDITKRLHDNRPVQVSVSLAFQPDWPQIERLLDTYTPGSQVGQVLRSLGLPTKREPEGPGRELWTYSKASVAYVVQGTRVVETRALPPGPGLRAAATGDGSDPDAPAPAVRVDTP